MEYVASRHSSRPARSFWATLSGLMTVHASRTKLSKLDDSLLSDIGVTRDQANAEAGRAFWDAPQHWKF